MARHLSEMMLIVRAQNQASGALRRVGKDLSMLGRHRALQIRQQQLLLNQQNLMRQRQRALNELQSITSGTRAINLQKAAIQLERQRNGLMQRRARIMTDAANISNAMRTGMDRMARVNNDIYRNETRRLQLASRLKQVQTDEANALRRRRELLKSMGGLSGVPKTDDAASKAGIKAIRDRAAILNRQLQSNADRNRELATSADQIIRKQGELGQATRLLQGRYAATSKAAETLAADSAKLAARQSQEAARARALQSELRAIGQRYAIVNAQQKELARTIHVARWDKLSTLGRTMQHLGRVGQYATLVFGGGLAYAAHQAAMFEKSVMLVATQTGKVDSNFGRTTATIVKNSKFLQKAFLGIQMDSTSSMEQINEAGYDLFSTLDELGESMGGLKRGVGILKLLSDAAIAGGTDINTVGDGVIATLSAFEDMPQTVGGVQKLLNRMFAAVRFGRMTFAEFAATLGTTTPAARAAGQSFDTLAGTIAFLSKPLGINKAAVGFARLTEILSRKKFVDGLKKAGVSITDANGKMLQMPAVIDKITNRFPELTKGGVKLMQFFKELSGTEGTIQARRAFVFLAQDLDGYRRIVKKTTTDNNEMDRSLKTMEATTGVRWEKFLNQLRATVLMIGAEVLPEILKLAPHIQRLVDWFSKMDPALRQNIVHMVAFGVAATAVASALLFVLGPIVRLIALLGKGRVLFLGIGVAIAAATVAIGLLTGDWTTLNKIIDEFFNLSDRGVGGWVAMFAIATLGALKLTKAINGVRNAWMVAGAASTGGMAAGSLGGLSGIFARGKAASANLKALPQAAAGATKLRTALNMAGLAAMAIPGPLWVAGGAIAAAGVGALLWKRHMDGVAASAEKLRVAQMKYVAIVSRPQTQAADFGKTGERINTARKLGIELQRQQLILKGLQAQYKSASGDQKKMLGLDIQDALIRVGEYTRMYANAQKIATASGNQLSNTIVSQARNAELYKQKQNQIKTVEAQLNALRARPAQRGQELQRIQGMEQLRNKLVGLKGALADIEARTTRTGTILRNSFNRIIKDMQAGALLPTKIPQGAIDSALRVAMARGRMLKPAEIKAVIRAYADKASLAKAKRDIQSAVKLVKVDLRIGKLTAQRTDLKSQLRKAMHTGDTDQVTKIRTELSGVEKALANSRTARKNINAVFSKTITQKVRVKVNPANTEPLGRRISDGIAAGITNGMPGVRTAVNSLIAEINRAAIAKAEIGSPSRLFERTVGIPIIRGILKGMLQKNEIQRTAALVVDLFNGAFLQKKQQKIDAIGDNKEYDPLKLRKYEQQAKDALARFKKTHKQIDLIRAKEYQKKATMMKARKGLDITDLIKDAKGQVQAMLTFNKSLEKLKKRGAPVGLLNDLRALGIDGLKYIKMLANATPAQLKKYTRAWNQMQGQIRRSQYQSVDDIKNWKQATLDQLSEFKEAAGQKLLDTWNELRSIAVNNMGGLFVGLEDKIGDGFQSALDEWQSQVDDYQSQIADLNQQIKDAHDAMQAQMGTLFQGDFLQNDPGVASKKEWGVVLGFDDLFADLKGQVDRFNKWRSLLVSLAAKVPPDLAKQFESLGPEAVEQLEILNGASAEQIAAYVATWQQGQDAIKNATANTTQELATQIGKLTDQIAALVKPTELSPTDVITSIQKQIGAFDEFETVLQALRGKNIPLELVKQIAEMGPDALPYMHALNNMTSGQLNQFVGLWNTAQQKINTATDNLMQDQLDMWYKHGANMASAIIAGVASEQQALLNFFTKLFTNLLQGKMPEMPGTGGGGGLPPGAVSIGGMGGAGGGEFFRLPDGTIVDRAGIPIGGSGGGSRGAQPMATTTTAPAPAPNVTHVTLGPIYAQESEDMMDVFERAAFRARNGFS